MFAFQVSTVHKFVKEAIEEVYSVHLFKVKSDRRTMRAVARCKTPQLHDVRFSDAMKEQLV